MTNEELEQLAEPLYKSETTIRIAGHSAIIVYDLDTHREEYDIAQDAGSMAAALFDIQQEVWRPSYKHGYPDPEIADLIKKIDDALEPLGLKDADGDSLCADSLIRVLMNKYHSILEEHGVSKYGNQ